MPLQLGRNVCLRLRPRDFISASHRQCDDETGAQIRCFHVCTRGKHGSVEDPVKTLAHDVDLLDAQSSPNYVNKESSKDLKCAQTLHCLSVDVQKQLQCVLGVIKDLTAEEGERTSQKYTTEEAVDLVEEFISTDLPVLLLEELPLLEFEARKDVMNVCCALLWAGMPQQVGIQVLQYLKHHPRVFPLLVSGYANEDTALHYGVVLRSYARHVELVEAFFKSRLAFDLVRHALSPSLGLSGDAFFSLAKLLLEHKEVSSTWVEKNFEEFFGIYNSLLKSNNFMLERQALMLLGKMLLDRHFQRVMFAYVRDHRNLQINMNFLSDSSRVVQFDAFQVFKIFAADPRKAPRVQQILFQNKSRLVELLQRLVAPQADDAHFASDKHTVIDRLIALSAPAWEGRVQAA